MVNSMSRKVFSEEKTGEFTTTITLKGFDLVTELVFNLFLKGNKDLEEIRLSFKRIQPSKPGVIINQNSIIFETLIRYNR